MWSSRAWTEEGDRPLQGMDRPPRAGIKDRSLLQGWGGGYNMGGWATELLRLKKGGEGKSFEPCWKGGGHKQFWGGFNTGS